MTDYSQQTDLAPAVRVVYPKQFVEDVMSLFEGNERVKAILDLGAIDIVDRLESYRAPVQTTSIPVKDLKTGFGVVSMKRLRNMLGSAEEKNRKHEDAEDKAYRLYKESLKIWAEQHPDQFTMENSMLFLKDTKGDMHNVIREKREGGPLKDYKLNWDVWFEKYQDINTQRMREPRPVVS